MKRENDYNADPYSEILITSGAQSAILASLMAILNINDEVILTAPYYRTYEEMAVICGAKIVPIITDYESNYTLDVNVVEEKITENTKAIILVSPSNPTGTVLKKEIIQEIYKLSVKHDVVLFTDEIYEHYIFDDNLHYSINSDYPEKNNVISIYSLSKGYGLTGIRVGYIVSNENMIASIAPFHHAMNICAPVNAQYASIEALNHSRSWFDEEMKNININRKLWIDTLRDLEIPFGESQGAYYICFDISKFKKSSKEVSQELREKHKLIINSQDENYLRASFMADKDTLEIGLNKLSEYFRNI
ncbi:uncharacterized protein METZ01_LOCUS141654 [marine metagenome]|uniref:Aminotransferase class I/classII large domain-containing protein n=1 Tax=marine metagenome TaxID=408172 RepID=A0A381ZHS1_9ZZZZ